MLEDLLDESDDVRVADLVERMPTLAGGRDDPRQAQAGLSGTPGEEVEMLGSGDPEFPSALVGLSGLREGLGVSPLPPSAWLA